MHKSIENFFSSKTTLIVCVAIGAVLWIANAVFNLIAKDYLSFAINMMYVTCLNVIAAAVSRNTYDTMQAATGLHSFSETSMFFWKWQAVSQAVISGSLS